MHLRKGFAHGNQRFWHQRLWPYRSSRLSAMANDPELDVVAVNDLGDIPTMAHLLKYDSVHGRAFDAVEVTEDGFVADGHALVVLCEARSREPALGELGVDVVIESTGIFKTGELAQAYQCWRQEGCHHVPGQMKTSPSLWV